MPAPGEKKAGKEDAGGSTVEAGLSRLAAGSSAPGVVDTRRRGGDAGGWAGAAGAAVAAVTEAALGPALGSLPADGSGGVGGPPPPAELGAPAAAVGAGESGSSADKAQAVDNAGGLG